MFGHISVCLAIRCEQGRRLRGGHRGRPSNKNKDNVELRFYSVVTCLSQFYIMYFNQMHTLTIRYRNNLNLRVLFHYCTNFMFLCVVKYEQETDSLDLSGHNQDDKLHR